MSLFKKFLSKMEPIKEGVASVAEKVNPEKVGSFLDIAMNLSPWIMAGVCVFGGFYGLGGYLLMDFTRAFRDNLKKSGTISDPVKDWYTLLDYEEMEEKDFKKNHSKELGKVSDSNALITDFKNVYEK